MVGILVLGGYIHNLVIRKKHPRHQIRKRPESLGICIWLVVEPTHLKNMLVKMGSSSPIFGVKIKKCLKPPPRYGIFLLPQLLLIVSGRTKYTVLKVDGDRHSQKGGLVRGHDKTKTWERRSPSILSRW